MNAVMRLPATLAETVREDNQSFISPSKVGEMLGLQAQVIAQRAGIHRNTLHARPQSERLQGYLREVVRVMTVLEELTGGDIHRAAYLFKNVPLPEYRGLTPDELVAEGKTEAVLAYYESILDGPSG